MAEEEEPRGVSEPSKADKSHSESARRRSSYFPLEPATREADRLASTCCVSRASSVQPDGDPIKNTPGSNYRLAGRSLKGLNGRIRHSDGRNLCGREGRLELLATRVAWLGRAKLIVVSPSAHSILSAYSLRLSSRVNWGREFDRQTLRGANQLALCLANLRWAREPGEVKWSRAHSSRLQPTRAEPGLAQVKCSEIKCCGVRGSEGANENEM